MTQHYQPLSTSLDFGLFCHPSSVLNLGPHSSDLHLQPPRPPSPEFSLKTEHHLILLPNAIMSSPEPKRQRRRQRSALACEQCRRRKIRCDQDHPCGACIRARASLECSYKDDPSRGVPISVYRTWNPAPSGSSSRAEARIRTQRDVDVQQEEPSLYPRTSVQQPTVRPESDVLPIPERESVSFTTRRPRDSVPLSSSTSVPSVTPRLRNVPEKTKLFGQTHWLHIAEKVCIPK